MPVCEVSRAGVLSAVRNSSHQDPYRWARAHRRMPGGKRYSIERAPFQQPFLRELYEAVGNMGKGCRRIVLQKAAQVGATELGINTVFWFLESKREGVLFTMPTDRMISDLSAARVDKAIKCSEHLSQNFTDTKNVGIKVGFGYPLYLRGVHSSTKLLEIPVGLVLRDEIDKMDPEGAEQALSRLGASQHKFVIDLSNPSFPESQIHVAYMEGTQEVWALECKCGYHEPRWPDSVEDGVLVCPECGNPVDKTRGKWIAQSPGSPYRSFRMSQLASPTVTPDEIAAQYHAAKGDATRLQVWWNYVMGLPFAPSGAKITDEILAALPRLGDMVLSATQPCVMGVDVGAVLHVTIRRLEGGIIWAGECSWEELPRKMHAYSIGRCGIDYMPETTLSKRFAKQFPGRVSLIRHPSGQTSVEKDMVEDGVHVISAPRTAAIDEAFARILNREEPIADNLSEDWFKHMKAPVRQIVKSPNGVERAVWSEGAAPDHYAMSYCYSELVRSDEPVWAQIGLMA